MGRESQSHSTWPAPDPRTFVSIPTTAGGTGNLPVTRTRGYTGQEKAEEFGIIHGNRRFYDLEPERLLSVDLIMQHQESTPICATVEFEPPDTAA
jgi:hypothetical protein